MMKKNQIFIKYLLEGFLFEIKAKFNSSLAKKAFNLGLFFIIIKKMQQNKVLSIFKQGFTLRLLFKHYKFHLQFKNTEDVDAFLKSLGLEELVEDQPNAREILQEIIQEDQIEEIKNRRMISIQYIINLEKKIQQVKGQHLHYFQKPLLNLNLILKSQLKLLNVYLEKKQKNKQK